MAAVKKHNLNDWYDNQLATHVLAVSSALPDYKLVVGINQLLGRPFFYTACEYTFVTENTPCTFRFFKSVKKKWEADVYLIVNQSFNTSSSATSTPLFGEIALMSRLFLQRLEKWDYLLISSDIDRLQLEIMPLIRKRFNTAYLFEFEYLKKNEQNTLTTFYYENKC